MNSTPALELVEVGKTFGSVIALRDMSVKVDQGAITCILGDNGAGKSTLIKILSGVHKPTTGQFLLEGNPVDFDSPRDAMARGIATVFQDLATIPLMSVWRNFFLGNELTKSLGPIKYLDVPRMREIAKTQLLEMGIDLRDTNQPIGTLSGGERQAVAIARAVYFGAKVLILDEPTNGLDPQGIAEIRHDRGDPLGRGPVGGVDHDHLLHQRVVERARVAVAVRLDDEQVPATDRLLEAAVDLAVGERLERDLAELDAEVLADPLGELRVRAAGEPHQPLLGPALDPVARARLGHGDRRVETGENEITRPCAELHTPPCSPGVPARPQAHPRERPS
mgnify:CR=1 FL=1